MNRHLTPDALDALPADTGLFAGQLDGNRLAPRFADGALLAVDPAKEPAAGDAVLAELPGVIRNPGRPPFPKRLSCASALAVMIVNGDGDLTDNAGGYHAAGAFTVRGVVVGEAR
jgi:hypothetical protein